MKIATIVGARPQYIKAAPVSAALRRAEHDEIFIDTGQHYDPQMAGQFFSELGLPRPTHDLKVGSGAHGEMTGRILQRLEPVLMSERPEAIIVFGDTNSTLAAALVAAKLEMPIMHVEAGLRSYRPGMPEEINRRLTDHVSDVLACPTRTAVENLKREGLSTPGVPPGRITLQECAALVAPRGPLVVETGDIVVDCLDLVRAAAEGQPRDWPDGYVLLTLHRAENTASPNALAALLDQIVAVSRTHPVIFPMHPRTRDTLQKAGLVDILSLGTFHVVEPLGYRDFITAMDGAIALITDSGGAQKEAAILGTPCVTLRDETEWVETVDSGWNTLVGSRPTDLAASVNRITLPADPLRDTFGDGRTADRLVALLDTCLR